MVFSLAFLIRFLFHDDEAHWLLRFLGGIERSDENPTIDLLDRLAKTLGVPLAELFVERKVKYGKPAELRRGRKAK